jgi:hypothetical protein
MYSFRLLVAVLGLCMASIRAQTCRTQNAPCSCRGFDGVITIGSNQTKGNPIIGEVEPGKGFVAYDNCLNASSIIRQQFFPDQDPNIPTVVSQLCFGLLNGEGFGYQEAGRLDLCLTGAPDATALCL